MGLVDFGKARPLRFAALALVLVGCSEGDSAEEPAGVGPRFAFALPQAPEAPVSMSTVPFPNDALLGADGTWDVNDDTLLLTVNAEEELRRNILRAADEARCFGVTRGVTLPLVDVPFDNLVDPASIGASNVRFVDLDSGAAVPFSVFYRINDERIVVEPTRGYVLTQQHSYAVVLTRGAALEDGTALGADADLRALLAGDDDPRIARAGAAYQPLRDYLTAEGIEPADVVAASVFTTCDFSGPLSDAAAVLDSVGPSAVSVARTYASGAELDDLMGTPDDNTFPGADNPGGHAHADIAFVVLGSFASPNFRSDDLEAGRWERDGNGDLLVKTTEQVPFILALPFAEDYADTPVVVFQHGLGKDRGQVLQIAQPLAAAGYAVIGIDIPAHGARATNVVDVRHNFYDKEEPDGLPDPKNLTLAVNFFGLDASTGIDPEFITSAFNQSAVDTMMLARVLDAGDWSALPAAEAALAGLSFDGDSIVFSSESFGGISGLLAMAYEPLYGAGFVSVAGGGLVDLLENSRGLSSLFLPLFAGAFGLGPNDVDPAINPPHTNAAFMLMSQFIDVGDPIGHAARLAASDKHLVMVNAFADEIVPNQSSQSLARALGLAWVTTGRSPQGGPLYIDGMATAPAPVAGNVDGATRVALEVADASHGMITRVNALRTVEPGGPPFEPIDPPIALVNPIVELLDMLIAYVDTYREGAAPELRDTLE